MPLDPCPTPPTVARGLARVWLAAAALSGCALTVRAPLPDPTSAAPARPAAEVSEVAAVARLSYRRIGPALDHLTIRPATFGATAPIGSWGLRIERSGAIRVFARGRRLCIELPIRAQGHVAAFGRRLSKRLTARLTGCGKPRLGTGGKVALVAPAVEVALDRGRTIGLNTQILEQTLARHLRGVVAGELRRQLRGIAIPIDGALRPLAAALGRPVALGGRPGARACLVLHPDRLDLAQPELDPGHLRLTLAVRCRPTVELPCRSEAPPARLPESIPIRVTESLRHRPTRMHLPLEVSLGALAGELERTLAAHRRIRVGRGFLELGHARVYSSAGRLVVQIEVGGRLRGSFVGLPVTKRVHGAFAVWGRPTVGAGFVGLRDVRLALDSDDRLTEIAAALGREQIQARIAARVRLPKARLLAMARERLKRLGRGILAAGQRWPIEVRPTTMRIDGLTARAGVLRAEIDLVAWIVIGDTRRL